MSRSALWDVVFEQMQRHADAKRDPSPLHALNRILMKHYGEAEVSPDTWNISLRRLTRSQVQGLCRVHSEPVPRDQSRPIVVVRLGERDCVVDGNKRTSSWLEYQSDDFLDAITIFKD